MTKNTSGFVFWNALLSRLLPLRPQLLRSVGDDPLQLLDALHHLGHRAGAVDQLAHFRVGELVRRDEGYEADRFSRALVGTHEGVMAHGTAISKQNKKKKGRKGQTWSGFMNTSMVEIFSAAVLSRQPGEEFD